MNTKIPFIIGTLLGVIGVAGACIAAKTGSVLIVGMCSFFGGVGGGIFAMHHHWMYAIRLNHATRISDSPQPRSATMRVIPFFLTAIIMFGQNAAGNQQLFADLVGNVKPGPVVDAGPVQMPFITWGGDVVTHYANGGDGVTKPGTIFAEAGLSLNLVPGDDFVQQLRYYISGKSPYLRGTMDMLAMASDLINVNHQLHGIVIYQLTKSTGGDNLVVSETIKSLTDLRSKRLALQQGGPHMGFLWDILEAAKLSPTDITIVWCKNLSGLESPAEAFKKGQADGCFVITPDLLALCGDYAASGSGAEGTVKGAHRLVGTAEMRESIKDVIAVREDYFHRNKQTCVQLVSCLLQATEKFVTLSKKDNGTDKEFVRILEQSRSIWGHELFPTLDDIRGLATADCSFVGFPGNQRFFTDADKLTSFTAHQTKALTMAKALGMIKELRPYLPSEFDYAGGTLRAGLKVTEATNKPRFNAEATAAEIEALNKGELDANTLLSFSVKFDPNQDTFDEASYGLEFQRAIETAKKFPGAAFGARAHTDPVQVLRATLNAGMKKGLITREGTSGNYRYSLEGKPLDIAQTSRLVDLINEGRFEPGPGDSFESPLMILRVARNLSKARAEALKKAIIDYAKKHGYTLDESQFVAVGVGVSEPIIPVPRNPAEAAQNMRCGFHLIKVSAETINPGDFDF